MSRVAFDSLEEPQVAPTRIEFASVIDSVDTVYVSVLLAVVAILLWRSILRSQRIHV